MNTTETIKTSSYYIITIDNSNDAVVRFYDRDGNELKQYYYTKQEIGNERFIQNLEHLLDSNNKWKIRPRRIVIYKSDLGRTLGYYDKNNNKLHATYYARNPDIKSILTYELSLPLSIRAPLDFEYLQETNNIVVQNDYDPIVTQYYDSFIMWINSYI